MKINKKKEFTLFALTLLVASLLLINMNEPTNAQPSSDLIYLHGPTLIPIHMNAWGGLIDLYNPLNTMWHELYPTYCINWNLTSWEDNGDGQLSPNDQIDMNHTKYYHVDRITVTLLLSGPYEYENHTEAPPTMAIELKLPDYPTATWFYYPNFMGTPWHEVWPNYCNKYILNSWVDDPFNQDGKLSFTDSIDLLNMSNPQAPPTFWHVEQVATDLILNQKITNPVSILWHELYPHFCNNYTIDTWRDNGDLLLSPCDYVNMTLVGGTQDEYHVENVTLTLRLAELLEPSPIYIESTLPFEEMYWPKTMPVQTPWHEVHPTFCTNYTITSWEDNCNGVLSYCDNITLENMDTGAVTSYHVDDVAIDIVVKKTAAPPPELILYWKPDYPDYAPSGMPDFDQKQDAWMNPQGGGWSWCAPTAVANSLWWLDSKFETGNTPPPAISDTFNLLTNFTAGIDDHDPNNVMPFITRLAYLMDTDGMRTKPGGGAAHLGTWTWDMETGIAQYLSWTGVNPQGDVNGDGIVDMTDYSIVLAANGTTPPVIGWDMAADIWPVTTGWPNITFADNKVDNNDLNLVTANMNKTGMFYERTWWAPDFYEVEAEVEKCEDVVLLLGFWNFDDQTWSRCPYDYAPVYPVGSGHAVTVAGINSTTLKIAVSDPCFDAFHDNLIPEGRVPVAHPPYPHNSSIHNNASLVSQDIYNVTLLGPGAPGLWALQGYVGAPVGYPIAIVEATVITSPLAVEVGGVDITTVDPSKTEAYPTCSINVTVTVHNNGSVPITFNLATYYQNVTTNQIGNQTVTLAVAEWKNVTFTWVLTGVPDNTIYTIKANATTDGTLLDEFINGQVKIRLWGDVNNDGNVNVGDMLALKIKLSGQPAVAGYLYDINCDGNVNVGDMLQLKIILST